MKDDAVATCDRRWFVRRVGVAALAAPAASLAACVPDGPRGEADASMLPEAGGAITRPILLAWSQSEVWIDAPAREMPVAYVSMGRRRLYVDGDFRDQVYWDLRAHISVSTGVWRIPLVGDPPREPIMPGDPLREFEELSMRDWDPAGRATVGDIRIMRGSVVRRRVELECAPLAGGGEWFRAGPWEILQAAGPTTELVREDFASIGTGMRYADRDCTRPRGNVDFLTWACPTTVSAG